MTTEVIKYKDIEAALIDGAELEVAPPEQVAEDIVRRILAADDLQGAFGTAEATPATEIADEIVTVHEVTWMRSNFGEGPPIYALMRVTRMDSAEQLVVSMGGRSVMAGFLWSQKHDAFPLVGIFRQRQTLNGSGNTYWTFTPSVTVAKA